MSSLQASLVVILGAVFLSWTGVFLRLIDDAGGFQILFYRSLTLTLVIAALICLRRHLSPDRLLRSLDRHDLAIGLLLSFAFAFYVFAILNTSVASSLFILTAAPLLAATTAWLVIGEKPHPFTWAAMLIASGGVLLMIGDGWVSGRTIGNIFALVAATSFAFMLVVARHCRKADILGGTLIAGLLSGFFGAVFSLTIGDGLGIALHDLLLVLAMGGLIVGPGIVCITWGTPYLPAAEVSLLVLAESALGPVWVWMFGFERITAFEFMGGGLVFAAVMALTVITGRGKRED